jgi:D-glutamate N-acetyltransferase
MQRFLILAEGQLDIFSAKTAVGVMRYRPEAVAAILDREHAGQRTSELLGVSVDVPIVATLAEGLAFAPDALLLGIAPAGGRLPEEWRALIREALLAGLNVVSGLHEFLNEDAEFRALAEERSLQLVDLRRPPEEQRIAHGEAAGVRARRVLTVGTDCNIGKKIVALELTRAAREAGVDARFLATGQTGVLISGRGVALDRVIADFAAGIVEAQVLENGDCDLLVIEGQGAILHPAYSGVTMALLHGSLPDALVLCHLPTRPVMRRQSVPIPPLPEWIALHEALLRPLHPARVVGIAVNTFGMEETAARATVDAAAAETGLPATDVIRYGCAPLLAAVTGR